MQTAITARHGEVPEVLRARAQVLAARLARLVARPTGVDVEFDFDHQRAVVEIRLSAARGTVLVAGAEAPDARTALDRAATKLRRQLDKRETTRRRVAAGRK